jgi:hypothetical protein
MKDHVVKEHGATVKSARQFMSRVQPEPGGSGQLTYSPVLYGRPRGHLVKRLPAGKPNTVPKVVKKSKTAQGKIPPSGRFTPVRSLRVRVMKLDLTELEESPSSRTGRLSWPTSASNTPQHVRKELAY